MTSKYMCSVFILLLIWGCKESASDYLPINPDQGWFSESPLNLKALNTGLDEYGTNLEGSDQRLHLYYSSNYSKRGVDFDIEGAMIEVLLNDTQDKVSIQVLNNAPPNGNQIQALINSPAYELGAFSFSSTVGPEWYFFYANDENGDYDIKYLYKTNSNSMLNGPFYANVLNSGVCDFYPTINGQQNQMIFSSLRGGRYDLYEINVSGTDFIEWLNHGKNSAVLNTIISSNGDDKYPYINENLLVFASNRPGGYGGYDLWYSVIENGQWTRPVNFGPAINSEYDEFRPATAYFADSKNDFMIFSSNKPGGKGGYDLYYTGIPKLIR